MWKILKYIAFSSHDHYNIWCEFGLLYGFSIRFFCVYVCWSCCWPCFVWQIRITICLYLLALRKAICLTHTQLVRHLFHFFSACICVYVYIWVRVCSFCAKRIRKNSKHQVKNNKNNKQKQSGGQRKLEKTKKKRIKPRKKTTQLFVISSSISFPIVIFSFPNPFSVYKVVSSACSLFADSIHLCADNNIYFFFFQFKKGH